MNRREFIGQSVGTAAALAGSVPILAQSENRPKKSVLFGMLPGKLSLEERFKLAKEVGFEGVEAHPVTNEQECNAMRSAAEKAGIPIHSVIFGGWGAPLSHPDPKVAQRGLEELKAGLQGARWMGATALLLVPAVVDAQTPYRDAYKRSQKGIRGAIPTAEKLGVTICIEEVWNNLLLSPLEFARYVDEFKHPLVQAYFDVGNVVTFGWPEDWIRTLGKRIKRVHLKDYKGGPGLFGGNKGGFVNLLDGSVNWKEVRKAFAEVKFTSYMTTELGGGEAEYLRDVSQRVDKILAM